MLKGTFDSWCRGHDETSNPDASPVTSIPESKSLPSTQDTVSDCGELLCEDLPDDAIDPRQKISESDAEQAEGCRSQRGPVHRLLPGPGRSCSRSAGLSPCICSRRTWSRHLDCECSSIEKGQGMGFAPTVPGDKPGELIVYSTAILASYGHCIAGPDSRHSCLTIKQCPPIENSSCPCSLSAASHPVASSCWRQRSPAPSMQRTTRSAPSASGHVTSTAAVLRTLNAGCRRCRRLASQTAAQRHHSGAPWSRKRGNGPGRTSTSSFTTLRTTRSAAGHYCKGARHGTPWTNRGRCR